MIYKVKTANNELSKSTYRLSKSLNYNHVKVINSFVVQNSNENPENNVLKDFFGSNEDQDFAQWQKKLNEKKNFSMTEKYDLTTLQSRDIIVHFSFDFNYKSNFTDIENQIYFVFLAKYEKFTVEILYDYYVNLSMMDIIDSSSLKPWKKKAIKPEMYNSNRCISKIDSFEITSYQLEQMVYNKNRGATIFLGKFTFFDNDL